MIQQITASDVRNWKPCYNPNRYAIEGKKFTTIDVLKNKRVPPNDRLWVVCREELISKRTLRLFAIDCARSSAQYVDEDEQLHLLNILEILEVHLDEESFDEIRAAARVAARDAARDAAGDAAWTAARDAASAAARDAAWAAVWAAASGAAIEESILILIEMIEEFE